MSQNGTATPSLPPADPSGEPLFAPTGVKLFGRKFTGLQITDNLGLSATTNNPITTLLREVRSAVAGSPDAVTLARIYGFVYMGAYYPTGDLPVMLVFGEGEEVPAGFENTIEIGGYAFSKDVFVRGVRVWELDALDAAVRIDVQIGWLNDLLLADAMNDTTAAAPDQPDMAGRTRAMGTGHVMAMMKRSSR
jgi:hypothetical protein